MNDQVQTAKLESVAEANETPDLETVMHLIWDRLDAAEAERRRTRRNAAAFATVVLAVAVLWTGIPYKSTAGGPLLMRDGDGNVRARVDTDPESGRTTFQLVDKAGTPQAVLGTDVAGPMLTFYDKQGSARMRLGLEDGSQAPIIDVVDRESGDQSRVDLVDLREARSVPLPSKEPTVRQASSRRSRPSRPVTYYTANPACQPGTLGCSRYTRVDRWPGEG